MQRITISSLKRIEDVYNLVRDNFLNKRSEFKESNEEFEIRIDDVEIGVINMSALTMLTCLLYSVRKHYQFPFIGTLLSQNEELFYVSKRNSSYLKSLGFFHLTQSLRIIQWNLPKPIPNERFNPTTGIDQLDILQISSNARVYYSLDGFDPYDKRLILLEMIKTKNDYTSIDELQLAYEDVKTDIKNDIKEFIANPIEDLFSKIKHGRTLKYNIVSYVSEILLNSFIHGREKPFLAIQRTEKLISVSIADDGAGLANSYENLHKQKVNSKEAIIRACEHRKNSSYGLFDVIKSVIGIDKPSYYSSDGHHGFFTISDGPNILKISRNNYSKLENGEIIELIHDTGLNIRGVRITLDILIR
ncbi:MAG: hypothetical protein JXQ87_14050 [Bacteroidia bacterium]